MRFFYFMGVVVKEGAVNNRRWSVVLLAFRWNNNIISGNLLGLVGNY